MHIDDTDISAMPPEAAAEYVLAFIKSLKETQGQKNKKVEELTLWQQRLQLAREKDRPDLVQEAQKREDSLRDDVAQLETEEQELLGKVTVLKENLKKLKTQFDYSIDAEGLLASLEMLGGEKDETAEKFAEMQAQTALEQLKKKMGGTYYLYWE